MTFTAQQVIDRARFPLNDDDKVRVTDVQCLVFVVDGILMMRKKRPDLFLGNWTASYVNLALSDPIALNEIYLPLLADYVSSRVEFRDDEFSEDSRASAFYQMFTQGANSL